MQHPSPNAEPFAALSLPELEEAAGELVRRMQSPQHIHDDPADDVERQRYGRRSSELCAAAARDI